MKDTQLIINNIALPYASHDTYKPSLTPRTSYQRMISGRMIAEKAAPYWKIDYSYDKASDALVGALLPLLRGDTDLDVAFVIPDSGDMLLRAMKCTTKPNPSIAFWSKGKHQWHSLVFTLEAVEGEDDA